MGAAYLTRWPVLNAQVLKLTGAPLPFFRPGPGSCVILTSTGKHSCRCSTREHDVL